MKGFNICPATDINNELLFYLQQMTVKYLQSMTMTKMAGLNLLEAFCTLLTFILLRSFLDIQDYHQKKNTSYSAEVRK